jgi:hypothetical protein
MPVARARLGRSLGGTAIVGDELVAQRFSTRVVACSVADAMEPDVCDGISAAGAPAELRAGVDRDRTENLQSEWVVRAWQRER